MSKVIDITEKLSFAGNPKMSIKGKEYEVKADAATVLKIMALVGDGEDMSSGDIIKMYELIFTEKTRNEIDKLNLQFDDFQVLIKSAISLITDSEDEPEGE